MSKILSFFLIISFNLASYNAYSQDFRAPLDIPLVLSGTFGELRSNHFHSGIDIKTQGRIGLPVYAIEEGYVSRIKIELGGYGKAIYISHPNGYTSVYAHLDKLEGEIDAYVKAMQYAKESFTLDLYPDSNRLQVQKGQVIAKSGNTGGSFGPHLHFEVRNTANSKPVNPLQFGFKVADSRAPEIRSIYLYALEEDGTVIKQIGSFKPNGKKSLSLRSRLPSNHFGLGIEAYDKQDAANNLNGNYQMEVLLNEEAFFGYKMDEFAFSETRYLNALIDYSEKVCCNKKPQNMFKYPNNPLSIYSFPNNGIIPIDSSTTLNFKLIAKDFAGNSSNLDLSLNLIPYPEEVNEDSSSKLIQTFYWDQINNFKTDSCQVFTSAGSFYQNFQFEYEQLEGDTVSPIHRIHRLDFPVHKYMRVLIKPHPIPEAWQPFAYAVSLSKEGKDIYEGGTWDGDFLAVKTRSFGDYTIRLDSTKPEISSINLSEKRAYVGGDIKFKIKDSGSGVKSYRVELDGDFLLFEYETKKNLLTYTPDDYLKPGEHIITVYVTDKVGNSSSLSIPFNYIAP